MNNATSNPAVPCSIGKIHRHCEPKFLGQLPKLVPVRRFAAALKRHDWNRPPIFTNCVIAESNGYPCVQSVERPLMR